MINPIPDIVLEQKQFLSQRLTEILLQGKETKKSIIDIQVAIDDFSSLVMTFFPCINEDNEIGYKNQDTGKFVWFGTIMPFDEVRLE